MFEKSLQDLVKGIRANKKDPAPFISAAIEEIKKELKSTDPFTKSSVSPSCWKPRRCGHTRPNEE